LPASVTPISLSKATLAYGHSS